LRSYGQYYSGLFFLTHSVYIKRGKVSVTYVRNAGRGQLSSE